MQGSTAAAHGSLHPRRHTSASYNALQKNLDKPLFLRLIPWEIAPRLSSVCPQLFQCPKRPHNCSRSTAIQQIDKVDVNFGKSLEIVNPYDS